MADEKEAKEDWLRPNPLCDIPCDHASVETCKGLRNLLMSASAVSHLPSSLRTQVTWVRMHEIRKKTGIAFSNGVKRKSGVVQWEKVRDRRKTVRGAVKWRLLRRVRDVSKRVREGPTYFDVTTSEFQAIFSHVGRHASGISITSSKTCRRVVVSITCMKTLLLALHAEPGDMEMFHGEALDRGRKQPHNVILCNPDHPWTAVLYFKRRTQALGDPGQRTNTNECTCDKCHSTPPAAEEKVEGASASKHRKLEGPKEPWKGWADFEKRNAVSTVLPNRTRSGRTSVASVHSPSSCSSSSRSSPASSASTSCSEVGSPTKETSAPYLPISTATQTPVATGKTDKEEAHDDEGDVETQHVLSTRTPLDQLAPPGAYMRGDTRTKYVTDGYCCSADCIALMQKEIEGDIGTDHMSLSLQYITKVIWCPVARTYLCADHWTETSPASPHWEEGVVAVSMPITPRGHQLPPVRVESSIGGVVAESPTVVCGTHPCKICKAMVPTTAYCGDSLCPQHYNAAVLADKKAGYGKVIVHQSYPVLT